MRNTLTNLCLVGSLAWAAFTLAGCASGLPTGPAEADALAEQYVAQSFAVGPGQDLSRLQQDQTQKDCTLTRANPTEEQSKTIKAREARNIVYPDDGKLLGDWKAGAKIFNAGFGFRVGSFMPTPPGVATGGNCYACHQGEAKEVAFGDMGPSLQQYAKLHGRGDAAVKFTYEKIYNARAYNACSVMPRLGHNKILSPKQVADLAAFLLASESPINQ